jgi:hypothetical protein
VDATTTFEKTNGRTTIILTVDATIIIRKSVMLPQDNLMPPLSVAKAMVASMNLAKKQW